MPKVRHILYLSSWYPNKYQTTVGNFVRRQACLLAEEYQVTVIHTVASDLETEFSTEIKEQDGIKEILVYHPRGKSPWRKRKYQRKALRMATANISNVDLVFSQILLPKAMQFVAAKKRFNCPWIHIEQGSYFRPEVWKTWPRIQKAMAKMAIKHVDRFLAVSEFLRKDLTKIFPSTEIDLITNHVNTELFVPSPKTNITKKFLHVSTLDPNTKNPGGIIEACRIVKEAGFEFELTFVSDGDKEHWMDMVKSHNLEDQIRFEGTKSWEDLPAFYQQSDAFILNSIYETFSIVIAEAWCTGTPVISTPVGIAHDLPEELGIQTKLYDFQSIANAMIQIIKGKTFDSEYIRQKGLTYNSNAVLKDLKNIISHYEK